MKILNLVALLLAVSAHADDTMQKPQSVPATPLSDDEVVQFFSSAAWFDVHAGVWQVPIHGWVYEPEDSIVRKATIAKTLKKKFQLETSPATAANFDRRINLMIADNERGKRVTIGLAGEHFTLPKSGRNGHFSTVLSIPEQVVCEASNNGMLHFRAIAAQNPTRVFTGKVHLVAPEGISVISDIDDTIKISEVTSHQRLFDYAFYRDFEAVPGMAERYQDWVHHGATMHFVSSSPWQLYAPLDEFVRAAGFPAATFNLKSVRFRDRSFFNLFKKGTATKPEQIVLILKRYPGRKFVLVGDNGEQDPEVYAGLMRKYPQQIARAYIRNVTGAPTSDERMRKAFAKVPPGKWRLFTDPATLALPAH